ncbi:MAG: YqeG family HAD IIIA-type phosphatase [Lachnospiraceae bacterium]
MNFLYPKEWVSCAYDIDYGYMKDNGYKGIIFDIDNTLVFHGAPANDEAVALFDRLHMMGFNTCLISNNGRERVEPFAKAVKSDFIWKAGKPATGSYIKAMKRMGTSRKNTFFVGDQLFTDVLGANMSGIYSILVNQLDSKEEPQIVLKRYLEKIVLYFYKKSGGTCNGN